MKKQPPENTRQHILTVSELNRLARNTLEDIFSGILIEGEISELLQHRSGHWYFTLKDKQSQVRVAMFRGANSRVKFAPANGQMVLLHGQLSIYEARGSYQFIAQSMQPAGEGKLQREYEQLKQRLSEEGYFDSERKSPLPPYPRQVVVITSPQGAALRDMLSTFRRRHAAVELVVVPVAVQGNTAAKQIARAIQQVNTLSKQKAPSPANGPLTALKPDAIIVGRGGGSLEDLWAFNEEVVAQAIHTSDIPIVSAVGHETDFCISDFVADVRAATPTAAAELLSPDMQHIQRQLLALQQQLISRVKQSFTLRKLELNSTVNRLQHPGSKLREYMLSLDHLDTRLHSTFNNTLKNKLNKLTSQSHRLAKHAPDRKITDLKTRLETERKRLIDLTDQTLRNMDTRLQNSRVALDIVSPLATLNRGYSITLNSSNNVIKSNKQLNKGEKIKTQLSNGVIYSTVEHCESVDNGQT